MSDHAGALEVRDFNELLGDQRAAERGRHRVLPFVHRPHLQRRQNVVPGKLLPDVDDMRSNGADRKRPFADVVELLSLAKIHRDCHDLGIVLVGEPLHGNRRVQPTRVRQDNSFHGTSVSAHLNRSAPILSLIPEPTPRTIS